MVKKATEKAKRKNPTRRGHPPEDWGEARAMWVARVPPNEIAEKTGIPRQSLYRKAKADGWNAAKTRKEVEDLKRGIQKVADAAGMESKEIAALVGRSGLVKAGELIAREGKDAIKADQASSLMRASTDTIAKAEGWNADAGPGHTTNVNVGVKVEQPGPVPPEVEAQAQLDVLDLLRWLTDKGLIPYEFESLVWGGYDAGVKGRLEEWKAEVMAARGETLQCHVCGMRRAITGVERGGNNGDE